VGGGAKHKLDFSQLETFAIQRDVNLPMSISVSYIDYLSAEELYKYPLTQGYIYADISLQALSQLLSVQAFIALTRQHEFLAVGSRPTKSQLSLIAQDHYCSKCNNFVTIFLNNQASQTDSTKSTPKLKANLATTFTPPLYPPLPMTQDLSDRVITDFCNSISPAMIEESGCAVCGELHFNSEMQPLRGITKFIEILKVPGLCRKKEKIQVIQLNIQLVLLLLQAATRFVLNVDKI